MSTTLNSLYLQVVKEEYLRKKWIVDYDAIRVRREEQMKEMLEYAREFRQAGEEIYIDEVSIHKDEL